jgi:hypothetical protein
MAAANAPITMKEALTVRLCSVFFSPFGVHRRSLLCDRLRWLCFGAEVFVGFLWVFQGFEYCGTRSVDRLWGRVSWGLEAGVERWGGGGGMEFVESESWGDGFL